MLKLYDAYILLYVNYTDGPNQDIFTNWVNFKIFLMNPKNNQFDSRFGRNVVGS